MEIFASEYIYYGIRIRNARIDENNRIYIYNI